MVLYFDMASRFLQEVLASFDARLDTPPRSMIITSIPPKLCGPHTGRRRSPRSNHFRPWANPLILIRTDVPYDSVMTARSVTFWSPKALLSACDNVNAVSRPAAHLDTHQASTRAMAVTTK